MTFVNTQFPPYIGISRGNRDYILGLNSVSDKVGLYIGNDKEFENPRANGYQTLFIDYSWPEFPELKYGKIGHHPYQQTVSQLMRTKEWTLVRNVINVRKCETVVDVPRSITTEGIIDQLSSETTSYLTEANRTFCYFFLSLYYRRYYTVRTQSKAKDTLGLWNEGGDWNREFMDKLREDFVGLKTFFCPYVYLRVWTNGTGMGMWDFDRLFMLDPTLGTTNLYKSLLNSYKPIKPSKRKIHMTYDAEEEEKMRKGDEHWNWRG